MKDEGHPTSLILVGGMPRSGTTMLAKFLSERFGIPFSRETHFFDLAYRTGKLSMDSMPDAVVKDPELFQAYEKIEGLPQSANTFRKLLRHLLGDQPVIGEKTPDHILAFPKLLQTDHNVRCVVVIRGFFDVTRSLKGVDWNTNTFMENIRKCSWYYKLAYDLQREHPECVVVLKYENLCRNPDVVYQRLETFFSGVECTSEQNELFDVKLEPWKANALTSPKVLRKDKFSRSDWVKFLFSFLVEKTCAILWRIKFL